MSAPDLASACHHGPELLGIERRQIALQIDHHIMARPPGRPPAARRRCGPNRRAGPGSVSTARPPAASIAATISGSAAATTTGPSPAAIGPRPDPHDHRHAGDIGQRLAGQPGRGHAGRDEQDRIHRQFMGGLFRPGFALKPATGLIYATLRRNDARGWAGNVAPYFAGSPAGRLWGA